MRSTTTGTLSLFVIAMLVKPSCAAGAQQVPSRRHIQQQWAYLHQNDGSANATTTTTTTTTMPIEFIILPASESNSSESAKDTKKHTEQDRRSIRDARYILHGQRFEHLCFGALGLMCILTTV